jgi:hypothetical protein
MQNKPASPPYYLECGENPLVKQEKGCPCFSAATIAGLMDVERIAESCDFKASAPVSVSGLSSFYFSQSASFYASTTFNNSGTLEISFGVYSENYDALMENSGTCNAYVSYSKSSWDETGSDSSSEYRSYSLNLRVTQEQFMDCVTILKKVNATLPKDICTITGVGD